MVYARMWDVKDFDESDRYKNQELCVSSSIIRVHDIGPADFSDKLRQIVSHYTPSTPSTP